ncbi:hypothetical protein JCM15415_09690 [Methanobacterium movens]
MRNIINDAIMIFLVTMKTTPKIDFSYRYEFINLLKFNFILHNECLKSLYHINYQYRYVYIYITKKLK